MPLSGNSFPQQTLLTALLEKLHCLVLVQYIGISKQMELGLGQVGWGRTGQRETFCTVRGDVVPCNVFILLSDLLHKFL